MNKCILVVFLLMFALATSVEAWTNVCTPENTGYKPDSYCKSIGKNAYDRRLERDEKTKGLVLGKIIGVAWRPKGTVIGFNPYRTAPEDSFYYIIDDGMEGFEPFLRRCREIVAK